MFKARYCDRELVVYHYLNGLLHKEDGPAMKNCYGDKFWFKKGLLHRLDGPACEYSDGSNGWYLNNTEYSEELHKKLVEATCW